MDKDYLRTKGNVDDIKIKSGVLIGTVIEGKYKVYKLLNCCSSFKMYLVKNERSGKFWAMKVCDKTAYNYNSKTYEAVIQELHMSMKVNHPNIQRIADVIEDDRYIYVILEYIEGISLEALLRKQGAQPIEQVIEWAKVLCDALEYLHSFNPSYIYCDMNPGNIILKADREIKLINFACVKLRELSTEGYTCVLMTKGYAAPEQFSLGYDRCDARTDIYGLGMTLHHLVTGVDPQQPPYETKPICQINSDLPKGLERIITKCVQVNPNDRYQTCNELLYALECTNYYRGIPRRKGIFEKLFKRK